MSFGALELACVVVVCDTEEVKYKKTITFDLINSECLRLYKLSPPATKLSVATKSGPQIASGKAKAWTQTAIR